MRTKHILCLNWKYRDTYLSELFVTPDFLSLIPTFITSLLTSSVTITPFITTPNAL